MDQIVAVVLIEVHQALGITVRGEDMAAGAQLRSQVGEVVDLAVEYGGHRPILVVHRLPASGDVDDRQSAHPEHSLVVIVKAGPVGAAVDYLVAHAPDQPGIRPIR
jgi:hypothetical protein